MKKAVMSLLFIVFLGSFSAWAVAAEISNDELNERLTKLEAKDGWIQHISISGVVEVEAGFEKVDSIEGDDEYTTDLSLATVELGVDTAITEHVTGSVLFLYEDGEDIVVDEGFIRITGGDSTSLYLRAGEFYVPFGNFESHMISDPLTLELAETRETALEVGFANKGFYGAAYFFNGDMDKSEEDSRIDNFGALAGYNKEHDAFILDVGIGYINNLMDSDGLTDALDEAWDALGEDESLELKDYAGGVNAHVILGIGSFTLIGEYTTALDDPKFIFVDGDAETIEKGEKMKAWNLEAGYAFTMAEKETTVAFSYQGSENTEDALPESRILVSIGMGIFENTSLALEYAHDEYESDDEADVMTAQLSIMF